MSTTYHTPITARSYANAAVYNAPLAELDAAIGAAITSALAIATANDIDVLDAQLRWWGRSMASLLSDVATSDYSVTYTAYDSTTKYAGSVHKQATVTWPDDSSGHCDAVEYPETPGVLQYWTASHEDSGKIVVMDTDGTISVITPDYYVDSAADPGGDGTLATPFDTLSDLDSLTDGDVVALKSDSHWRETLDLVSGVSVYRYGEGARPIIDASDIITGEWTNDGTYTNLWYIDVTPYVAGTSDINTNLWVDGAYPADARSATLAAANGAAGSWYVDNDLAATQRIHYYPPADNPNIDGKQYEFNSRGAAVEGSDPTHPANVVLDGIVCRRQRSGSGSAILGRNAITRHCQFVDGTKHNFYTRDGWTSYGCEFTGTMWAGLSATLSVYNEGTPAGLGINTYDAAYDSERTTYTAFTGSYGHYNTSGDFGPVVYSRCYFKRLAGGIQAGNGGFDGMTVSRCAVVSCTAFVALSTLNSGTVTVEYNIASSGVGRFAGPSVNQTFYIRNNYIYASGLGGCVQCATGTAYIYDNEFKSDSTTSVTLASRLAIRYENASTSTVYVYDNKFLGDKDGSGAANWGFYHYSLANPTPRIYTDRNHYGAAAGYCYFPQNSFNAAVSTFPGAALTNVSGLNGTSGDGSQEANATIYS